MKNSNIDYRVVLLAKKVSQYNIVKEQLQKLIEFGQIENDGHEQVCITVFFKEGIATYHFY